VQAGSSIQMEIPSTEPEVCSHAFSKKLGAVFFFVQAENKMFLGLFNYSIKFLAHVYIHELESQNPFQKLTARSASQQIYRIL
jgi:hypothetical protein